MSATRPRGTPSTCAASNSASARGEATPAAASVFAAIEMTGAAADRSDDSAGWRSGGATASIIGPDRVRPPADAAGATGRTRVSAGERGLAGQPRGPVRLAERVQHAVQLAGQDQIQVVRRVADAMVGDPVLREVVGADALGAVHRAYLGPAGVGRGGGGLLLGERGELGPQHAHRTVLVLQLRTLVLAGHHDAGRQVGDAHGA